jgi:predicted phosphate transport protein (TIGR00153 family)
MFRSDEMKKEFLKLFGELADKIREGSGAFRDYLGNCDKPGFVEPDFRDLEQNADSLTHKILEKLYKTYMTPFEPEDIRTLAERMDSILDLTASAQKKLGIFKLKRPLDDMVRTAAVLDQAILKIAAMVKGLADPKQFEAVLQQCAEVRALENQADNLCYELIRDLFSRETDPVELFNRKQILENINEALDRCKDAAGTIEGIILKNG